MMHVNKVSAFRWVPPFAQGLVRDLRVRWALEEAGLPYEEWLIGPGDQQTSEYRTLQPFGQVPAFVGDDVEMFESGAIVLWIAERSNLLMPADPRGRARTQTWMFAALNSIEPHLQNLTELDLFHAAEAWTVERRPALLARARSRLADLVAALGNRDYLMREFSAGDLLMATVLRIPRHIPLVAEFPPLAVYLERCESRPAFQRALSAQLSAFERHAPHAA